MRFFTTVVLFLALDSVGHSDVVLKDHVTNSINWGSEDLIAHEYPPAFPNGSFGAAATFVGNGELLKTVSGVFAHDSPTGVPNGGRPDAMDFRFAFFQDLTEFMADPFLESPAVSPNVLHVFGSVSNQNDWLTPIGTSSDGHSLFRWEVDVEFLSITTTLGETHLVSLIPETSGLSGPTSLVASNGTNATGFTEDYFASKGGGAATLLNVGAVHPYAAYRVTTVPEPSAALLVGLTIMVAGSHKRIRHRFLIACNRNNDLRD